MGNRVEAAITNALNAFRVLRVLELLLDVPLNRGLLELDQTVLGARDRLTAIEDGGLLRRNLVINTLILLNDVHELLVHLPLLLVLVGCDLLDVLVLTTRQLLFTQVLGATFLPYLVEVLLLLRDVLLGVEQARRGQDLIDSLDMGPCTILRVELRLHVNDGVRFQVHLGQVTVVAQPDTRVLQVVVGEKAGEDVLTQELSQLEDELVLKHLCK